MKSRGGRFLRQIVLSRGQAEVECWVRCAESVVRTKVKQALRDMSKQSAGISPSPKTVPQNLREVLPSNAERQIDAERLPRKQSDHIPSDLPASSEHRRLRDIPGRSNRVGNSETSGFESSSSHTQLPVRFPPFLPDNRVSKQRGPTSDDDRPPERITRTSLGDAGLSNSVDSTGRFERPDMRAAPKLPGMLKHSDTAMVDSTQFRYNFPTASTRQLSGKAHHDAGQQDRKLTAEELRLLLGADPSLASRASVIAGVPQAAQLLDFDRSIRYLNGQPTQNLNPAAAFDPLRLTRPSDHVAPASALPLNERHRAFLSSANASSLAEANTGISTNSNPTSQEEDKRVPSVTMSRYQLLQRYLRQEEDPRASSVLTPSELAEVKLELQELEKDEASKKM